MKIVVNKQQAATAQLETAIKLFLENRDHVSAYTVASAAGGILEGVWKNTKDEHILRRMNQGRAVRGIFKEEWEARLNPEIPKNEGFSYLYKHQNFFKHADRDHDATIEFPNFELTALQIFLVTGDYTLIYDKQTKAMTLFFGWYAAFNPAVLGEGHPLLDFMRSNPFDASQFTHDELALKGYEILIKQCPELFPSESLLRSYF
jgi:hypothetical protein